MPKRVWLRVFQSPDLRTRFELGIYFAETRIGSGISIYAVLAEKENRNAQQRT